MPFAAGVINWFISAFSIVTVMTASKVYCGSMASPPVLIYPVSHFSPFNFVADFYDVAYICN